MKQNEKIKPHAGFEPATFRLLSERSTNWANAAYDYLHIFFSFELWLLSTRDIAPCSSFTINKQVQIVIKTANFCYVIKFLIFLFNIYFY